MSAEIIDALKNTPIPTILIFAGLFFILLAFVSKVGGVIEVQPAQQKWSAPIGLALLAAGLVLALNTPPTTNSSSNESSPSATSVVPPPPISCAALLSQGKTLTWSTRNLGKADNSGTLQIVSANAEEKRWEGDQLTKADGSIFRVSGSFDGFEMTMDHPTEPEVWFGRCGSSEIKGVIKTTYESQLTFEMKKQ
ncbi:hypothetical protein [Nodosilinea sp. FACHB-13]|uniref:hypothetical protein n=1 Tax=Cyanophyceae TaxID=3028117 RepID=UPI0016897184|nr:hypothetical protein [Nodosilinea sp. FACHB-13]MBD2108437.1 hypothetical protein [Nodosilinea sp. FACHB-13]